MPTNKTVSIGQKQKALRTVEYLPDVVAFEAPGLALCRCKTELDSFSFAKGRKNRILSEKTVFLFSKGNSPHDGSKKPLEFRDGLFHLQKA